MIISIVNSNSTDNTYNWTNVCLWAWLL